MAPLLFVVVSGKIVLREINTVTSISTQSLARQDQKLKWNCPFRETRKPRRLR